ncbi:hypothetical protein F5B20DRAFT_547781 [Whalleya microplaca]|nr:hypothetical protein F5B20DRAFT_547781 [Whalleya microplaca]
MHDTPRSTRLPPIDQLFQVASRHAPYSMADRDQVNGMMASHDTDPFHTHDTCSPTPPHSILQDDTCLPLGPSASGSSYSLGYNNSSQANIYRESPGTQAQEFAPPRLFVPTDPHSFHTREPYSSTLGSWCQDRSCQRPDCHMKSDMMGINTFRNSLPRRSRGKFGQSDTSSSLSTPPQPAAEETARSDIDQPLNPLEQPDVAKIAASAIAKLDICHSPDLETKSQEMPVPVHDISVDCGNQGWTRPVSSPCVAEEPSPRLQTPAASEISAETQAPSQGSTVPQSSSSPGDATTDGPARSDSGSRGWMDTVLNGKQPERRSGPVNKDGRHLLPTCRPGRATPNVVSSGRSKARSRPSGGLNSSASRTVSPAKAAPERTKNISKVPQCPVQPPAPAPVPAPPAPAPEPPARKLPQLGRFKVPKRPHAQVAAATQPDGGSRTATPPPPKIPRTHGDVSSLRRSTTLSEERRSTTMSEERRSTTLSEEPAVVAPMAPPPRTPMPKPIPHRSGWTPINSHPDFRAASLPPAPKKPACAERLRPPTPDFRLGRHSEPLPCRGGGRCRL